MALKDTTKQMEALLEHIQKDLGKAMQGNKAACQRVRTGTIKLEKVAKKFRKESVQATKKGQLKKSTKKAATKKKATKKAAPKRKVAKKAAPKRKAAKKSARKAPARKAVKRKTTARKTKRVARRR